MTRREYLESIMPTREMVDHFVTPAKADVPIELAKIMCNNAQSAFDPEIGWVVCDGFRGGGIGNSRGFYAYEKDGARRVVNYADRPCRIHTYGNSFTHWIRSAMGRHGRSIWLRICWNPFAITALAGTVCIRRIGEC